MKKLTGTVLALAAALCGCVEVGDRNIGLGVGPAAARAGVMAPARPLGAQLEVLGWRGGLGGSAWLRRPEPPPFVPPASDFAPPSGK